MNAKKYLALKKPCADCPFVVQNAFPLARERRSGIAASLGRGETFSCHKTVEYTDDGPVTDESSRCFGAASVLHKSGMSAMQAEQILTRLGYGEVNYDSYNTDTTFATMQDFVESEFQ